MLISNLASSVPPILLELPFPIQECDPLPHFFIIYSSLKLSHKDFCIFLSKYTRKEMNCQSIEVIYSVRHRELLVDQRTQRNKHKNNHAFCSVEMPRPEITVLINWFQKMTSLKDTVFLPRKVYDCYSLTAAITRAGKLTKRGCLLLPLAVHGTPLQTAASFHDA